MKSVKPGRGPSFMEGFGSIIIAVLGVCWILAARWMGAPFIFTLFGVGFVILAILQAVFSFINAAGKQRFSTFDIADNQEEPDPLNERFGSPAKAETSRDEETSRGKGTGQDEEPAFCPYCGEKAESGYRFCSKCGRELPHP